MVKIAAFFPSHLLALLVGLALNADVFAIAQSAANDSYEKANQAHAKDKAVDAIIELKGALQADPEHLPSLVLAGQIYIEQALGLAAEESLRTALTLKGDRNLILPLLGEALLQQGKTARLIGELQPQGLNADGQARVHTLLAQAYMLRSDPRAARRELDAALAASPGLLEAQVVDISWLMNDGQVAKGLQQLDTLSKNHAERSEVWSLSGAIKHARGDFIAALQDYDRALSLTPRNLDVRIARLGLLIDLKRDGETAADFTYLEREFKHEPRAAYLRSVVASRAGDVQQAQEALQQAVTALAPLEEESYTSNPTLYLMKGLAHYGLRQYELAIPALQSYVVKMPDDVGARKALGDSLLKTGSAKEAVSVLESAVALQPQDSRGQMLLATAYAVTGMGSKATAVLERIAGDQQSGSAARTKLAMINIGAGRVQEGLSELASSFARDPADAQSGVALVVTYLKTGQSALASEAARKLLASASDNIVYINLLGVALFMDNKLDDARGQFTAALNRDPAFTPAAINLGKLELKSGQFDAARTRFQQMLGRTPNEPKLLLEASRVEIAAGNSREGMRLAAAAARHKEASLDAIFHFYDLLVADGKLDDALELALRASAQNELNFDLLERLALLQLRMNDRDDARVTMKHMSEASAFDVDKQLRTAGYMASIGQYADVDYVLFKALQQRPKDRTVRLARVDNSLRKGAFDEALERATELISDERDFAPAYYLRGEARQALRRHDEALLDFDKANGLAPNAESVLGGYRALRDAGRGAQARSRLEARLKSQPKDMLVRMTLAEDHIAAGEYAAARQQYETLLAQRPGDPDLINNYAYSCLQLGDKPEALRAARKAHKIAPQNAMVNDTLGWILVQSSQPEEGLPFLRDAAARASDDGEIHYHLAVALHGLGRGDEARAEITRALAVSRPFASVEQARALQTTLSSAAK